MLTPSREQDRLHTNFTLTRGTQMIGDTLFVDGTPYCVCGHCGDVIKKFEGVVTVVAGRDKRHKEIKPFRITVLYGYLHMPEELIYVKGVATVKQTMLPILKQLPGCVKCHTHQSMLKVRVSRLADWAYAAADCEAPKLTATLLVK